MEANQNLSTVRIETQDLTRLPPASKKIFPNLTGEEKNVLILKYKSTPYGKMTDVEILISAKVAIFKIGVITGWQAPMQEQLDVLIDQFTKKLREGYSNVNADELEFAFRNNTSVKDWGKSMNLALIDEVMVPYLERRASVSRIEETANKPPQKAIADIPMTDQELFTATFETYKLILNYNFIPVSIFNHLVSNGIEVVTKERKREIFEMVKNNNPDMLYQDGVDLCKKMAVAEYFNQLIEKQKQAV